MNRKQNADHGSSLTIPHDAACLPIYLMVAFFPPALACACVNLTLCLQSVQATWCKGATKFQETIPTWSLFIDYSTHHGAQHSLGHSVLLKPVLQKLTWVEPPWWKKSKIQNFSIIITQPQLGCPTSKIYTDISKFKSIWKQKHLLFQLFCARGSKLTQCI